MTLIYAPAYEILEGNWLVVVITREGDISGYAGLGIQPPSSSYPTSSSDSAFSLYPYENYSTGWHGDWSFGQGSPHTAKELIFEPNIASVSFTVLLREDGLFDPNEVLEFELYDLSSWYSGRHYLYRGESTNWVRTKVYLQALEINDGVQITILEPDTGQSYLLSRASSEVSEGSEQGSFEYGCGERNNDCVFHCTR